MILNMDWQSFGVMNINPSDTLFVRCPKPPTDEEFAKLQAMLPGTTIIFVSLDTDIAKLVTEYTVNISNDGTYASAAEHDAEMSSKAQEFNPVIGKVISEDTMEVTP